MTIYLPSEEPVIVVHAMWGKGNERGPHGRTVVSEHTTLFVRCELPDGSSRECVAGDFTADGGWDEVRNAILRAEPEVFMGLPFSTDVQKVIDRCMVSNL